MDTGIKRIFYLDVLRVIAILAVIMLHCSSNYVINYKLGSIQFLLGDFFNSLSRIGVPLFVMISGALMLDETKELPISKIKNKIIKLVYLLAGWSFFYTSYIKVISPLFFTHKEVTIKSILWHFLHGHYHLWYLYMLLGLYLLLPVLRLFVKIENKKYIYYIIALSVLFQFMPDIFMKNKYVSEFFNQFDMDFVKGYWIYFIVGWIICRTGLKLQKIQKYFISMICFCSWIAMFFCFYFFNGFNIFSNKFILLFLYSTTLFITIKNLIEKYEYEIPISIKNTTSHIANLSFGIYLIHVFVLDNICFLAKVLFNIKYENANCLLYIFITFVLTVFISYIISNLLYKNKFMKNCIKI